MIKENLTLREIKNEIIKLQNELELYLEKKKINFERTQPSSPRIKEIISKGGNIIFDCFTTYMINDEECDDNIYFLKENILAYNQYLIKELNRMRKYDDVSLIFYLKEEENMPWKEIDKILNCGEDYSRTKYKRFKKDTKISN